MDTYSLFKKEIYYNLNIIIDELSPIINIDGLGERPIGLEIELEENIICISLYPVNITQIESDGYKEELDYQSNITYMQIVLTDNLDEMLLMFNNTLRKNLLQKFSMGTYKLSISSLKNKYHDNDTIMLHSIFECLLNFVEVQKGLEVIDWTFNQKHIEISKEIEYLYEWWKQRITMKFEDSNEFETQYIIDNNMMKRLIEIREYLLT